MAGSDKARRTSARLYQASAVDVSILLAGLIALTLWVAGARAPHSVAVIPPKAISSDGGHAFVFAPGFAPRWPFAVPSHPDFVLAPDDVHVLEDGRPIGAIDPAHADIRERGRGLFNFWQESLWFSPSDGSDPRTNGRDYRLVIRDRLVPSVAATMRWSLAFFAVLGLLRLSPAAARLISPVTAWARPLLARAKRVLDRSPFGFTGTFSLACALTLGAFALEALARPMPLAFEVDSFSFIQTGLLWDAGRDVAATSTRDVGYPAVAALALTLGSFGRLPSIQLVLVLAGLACMFQVLYRAALLAADRFRVVAGFPTIVSGAVGCALAIFYLLLLSGHDLFVIDIYSVMGEAPHLLPTAAALAFFVAGRTARSGERRLPCAVAAATAAYLSIMVKPHTAMVLLLCGSSLALDALLNLRAFRSPAVLASCVAGALTVGLVGWADRIVTPKEADFGSKTIMCNHLDVVVPGFDASTPGRARVAALMREVLESSDKWPLLGLNGDACVYNNRMSEAVKTVARDEGLSTSAWQGREFLRAVAARPGAYARDVFKQLDYYLRTPVVDVDHRTLSVMPDDVWERLTPFMGRVGLSRADFVGEVDNWLPAAYPWLSSFAKTALSGMGATFAPVTLSATVLALVVLVAFRRRTDPGLEIVLLSTAAFTVAFATTTALSHSFDISRYLTDLLPFSLMWWLMSAAYLVHTVALYAVSQAQRNDGFPTRGGFRHLFKSR